MSVRCKPAQWQRIYIAQLPELMTVEEYAILFRKSQTTVRKHCQQGILPACKDGKEWRISKSKVLERFNIE